MPNELVSADAEHPLVLHGLIRKRSEIAGQIEEHRREVRRLVDQLEHVDATLRIFAPELDVCRIRAKPAPAPHRAGNGQVTAVVLDALRDSDGPLTTPELAMYFMDARGLGTDDPELARLMTNRLRACLNAQRNRGVVKSTPQASGLLGWELA